MRPATPTATLTAPAKPTAAAPAGVPYTKNGHIVIDTPRVDPGGHVPTHRLDQSSGKLPGESWTDYENRVIGRSSFSGDTAKTSSLSALQQPVAESARALMAAAKADGVKLGVVETKRTQERQEMLFQKGRKPQTGDVVTWTLTSDHTPGRAIDFDGSNKALDWLQKNAPRFGFAVMGAMDPGHVSIP